MKRILNIFTTLFYITITLLLFFLASLITLFSIKNLYHNILTMPEENFILLILQAVGAIIIAVAIVDVAKYMIEEEILKNKELRRPQEARETLTKIMVIISIAVGIEGLVYIFKAGTTDMTLLVYPSLLIFASITMVVGLGLYQKLSAESEEKIEG